MKDIIGDVLNKARIEEEEAKSYKTEININGVDGYLVCEPEEIIYPYNKERPRERTGRWMVYVHKGLFLSFEYLTDIKYFKKPKKAKKYYDKLLENYGKKIKTTNLTHSTLHN